jgi:DNA modification methylase
VLRVLKPGGHILAFNHSRTFHRMAVAIEDAGFEIRDTIMWLYGSGFPKSHDISKAIDRQAGAEREEEMPHPTNQCKGGKWCDCQSLDATGRYSPTKHPAATNPATEEAKQWEGWGTALKPAYEPILLARKPIPTTVADNVLTHGVGGLNIDECRVGTEIIKGQPTGKTSKAFNLTIEQEEAGTGKIGGYYIEEHNGRFPANVIHDGSEKVVEGFPETVSGTLSPHHNIGNGGIEKFSVNKYKEHTLKDYGGDSGSASRFFYTAKASKKDRDEGLSKFEKQRTGAMQATADGSMLTGSGNERLTTRSNIHPTVKPTDLMQYLIRLIAPKGATVLDLFMGSGSTGKAAMIENVERDANYHFIGIDRTEEYMPIAEARIEFGLHYLAEKPKADGVVHTDQIDLFSLL